MKPWASPEHPTTHRENNGGRSDDIARLAGAGYPLLRQLPPLPIAQEQMAVIGVRPLGGHDVCRQIALRLTGQRPLCRYRIEKGVGLNLRYALEALALEPLPATAFTKKHAVAKQFEVKSPT